MFHKLPKFYRKFNATIKLLVELRMSDMRAALRKIIQPLVAFAWSGCIELGLSKFQAG